MNQLKSGKKSGPNRMVLVETSPIYPCRVSNPNVPNCKVVMGLTNLWDNIACKSNLTSGGINPFLVTRCDYYQHVEDRSRDMYGQRVDSIYAFEI